MKYKKRSTASKSLPFPMASAAHEALQRQIQYHFADPKFLERALTHSSANKLQNNQRLEFLGDSVLGVMLTEELYHRYPNCSEGLLTRMRAQLVNGKTLSEVATRLNLWELMRFGPAEKSEKEAQTPSILEDALEALLGAIYLDGGLEQVRNTIRVLYQDRLRSTDLHQIPPDPKTQLQEYCQAQSWPLPQYTLAEIEGIPPHQKFSMRCTLQGPQLWERIGAGKNKKAAQQEAALRILRECLGCSRGD